MSECEPMEEDTVQDEVQKSNFFRFRVFKIEKITPAGNSVTGQLLCPKARSGHRCVVDNDGNLYSFGGFNPNISDDDEEMSGDPIWQDSNPLFRELWKFNLATKCWTRLQTSGFIPTELASHSAVLAGGRTMLVYGGTGVPFGTASSNSLHTCDLDRMVWNQVDTDGNRPEEQYGQAIALHNGSLYVVGGTTGFLYSMDVHRLDLSSFHWDKMPFSTVANKPRERYRHEIAIYQDKLFLFGGGTAIESYGFKRISYYDLKKQDWEKVRAIPYRNSSRIGFPAKRRCHSLVLYGNEVYLTGGFDGSVIFDDLWKCNLETLQWTKLPVILPTPVYFHSAGITKEGCLFVYGGVTNIALNTRTSDICLVWVKIPSLSEMCWQAMIASFPKLLRGPRNILLELGIPIRFVERIQFYPECG